MEKAVITALWIRERKPDMFSFWIQVFLTYKFYIKQKSKLLILNYFLNFMACNKLIWNLIMGKTELIPYSHNAIIYKNKIWHATTPGGVVCESIPSALRGSQITRKKVITLDCSEDFFHGWLLGELGKDYCNRQNVAGVFPVFQRWAKNGDKARNCSEFLARICQWSQFRFPKNSDYILPIDTERVIKPDVFNFN